MTPAGNDISVGRVQYRITFPPGDRIGRAVQSGRPYELDLLEAVSCLVRPDEVAIDVGANIGNHALYLAAVCRMNVHAYEPNPAAVAFLEENVALNGLGNRISIRAVGLSNFTGRGTAVDREDEPGLHTVAIVPDEHGSIPLRRLDDIEHSGGRISLIKIDVEGGEPYVLAGAAQVIRAHRPVIVTEAETDSRLRSVDELLIPQKYWRLPLAFAWTPTYMYLPNKTLAVRFLRRPSVFLQLVNQYARGRLRRFRARRASQDI